MTRAHRRVVFCLFVATATFGCRKKQHANDLAPVSSGPLEAPKVATATATMLTVDTASSSVKFLMDSPLEKIDGDAPASATGELALDLDDLAKSTGLVRIDLDKLVLYQQVRPAGTGKYEKREMNPLQNEHARDWLQIVAHDDEVTPEQVAQNRIAEFRIEKVEPSVKGATSLTGADRELTATVTGTFRLHGRQAEKRAKIALAFHYSGDKLESLGLRTLEPFTVNLEEFEIHPRDGAGKLVKSITETIATTLKGKIKGEAPIVLDLTAKPH